MAEIIDEQPFALESFDEELTRAPDNLAVGTSLWFTNPHVNVWEVRLEPGERAPFHAHTRRYFWTCVDPGTAAQRTTDGVVRVRRYAVGDTLYTHHDEEQVTLHDLENTGNSTLRFVTVELLDPLPPTRGGRGEPMGESSDTRTDEEE